MGEQRDITGMGRRMLWRRHEEVDRNLGTVSLWCAMQKVPRQTMERKVKEKETEWHQTELLKDEGYHMAPTQPRVVIPANL